MSLTGTIFDVKRYAIHDGPGIRTTVFFKGCPMNCVWCHNPESIDQRPMLRHRPERCLDCRACAAACPSNAVIETDDGVITLAQHCKSCGQCVQVCPAEARQMVGYLQSVDALLATIAEDSIFFDQSGGGVTFSGGEPLRQPAFLSALLEGCGDLNIHTAVDTSGYANSETVRAVAGLTDLILYDLKLMDAERHMRYTGRGNQAVLENLQMLAGTDTAVVVVRFPLIPGITDDDDNIDRMGAFLAGLPAVPTVEMLPYHPSARHKYRSLGLACPVHDVRPPSVEDVGRVRSRLAGYGLQVSTGG